MTAGIVLNEVYSLPADLPTPQPPAGRKAAEVWP